MSLTPEQMLAWWDGAAKENPMTAILSNKTWDAEEFFKTGKGSLDECLAFAATSRLQPSGNSALDFGCGMGRMTHALARHFGRAIGIDISPEMIRLANEAKAGLPIDYIQVPEPPFPLPDRCVDFAFSVIVIQHIPMPYSLRYVDELFRVASDSVMFDAPSHKFKDSDPEPSHGIFLTPMADILAVAKRRGFELAAARHFPVTETRHYQYFFKRL